MLPLLRRHVTRSHTVVTRTTRFLLRRLAPAPAPQRARRLSHNVQSP